ncbi:MAG: aldehyde ferredoxin oxidoreductase C-terminal domain-containing protein, partial [Deltaproteobacteria bacterium]|nr:aldehyde ferredoxin oxidoreductase C-terminal domain-containing protein [Deltaproteobacteria bacterium]
LEKGFNMRAGFDASHDTLPDRFTKEPIPDGPAEGQISRISEMIPEYYHLRGWNEKGEPLPETMRAFDLEEQ